MQELVYEFIGKHISRRSFFERMTAAGFSAVAIEGILSSVEAAEASVGYRPPYSPDLNPIEKMWSKVKACLRAEEKRTKRTLLTAIGKALKTVTKQDCQGFFRSSGINATSI